MTDTDPEMMRRQQAKDVRQSIAADETRPRRDRSDSDPGSAADRAAAKNGELTPAREGRDAVLKGNRRSDYSREADVLEEGETNARPPLARKDRSLLGQ